MSEVTKDAFGIYGEGDPHGAIDSEQRDRLANLLRAHRLVVVIGPRLSGRSRLAYATLRHGFASYELLRPAPARPGANPPLTELLTRSVLRLRGGYALWLEDLGALMQDGFDPRAVERWLSAGRRRVAVARMTPAEFHRFSAAESAESESLDRAIPFQVNDPQREPSSGSPEHRYKTLVEEGSRVAPAIEHVATMELLGVPERRVADVNKLLGFLGSPLLDEDLLARRDGEPGPLLAVDDAGQISVHPAVVDVVDARLHKILKPLQRALRTTLEPRGLMAVSQALAIRRQYGDASDTLDLARERAGGDPELSLAITRTSIRLMELEEGSSGVTLVNPGGFDHRELIGWEVLQSLKTDPPEDPLFDLSPPEENARFAARLYRLTVYRAAARAVTLAILDALALFGAAIAALCVRAAARNEPVGPFHLELAKLAIGTIPVGIVVGVWVGLYRSNQARAQTQLILATTGITTLTVAFVYFARKVQGASLAALVTFFVTACVLYGILRYAYDLVSRDWVRRRNLLPRVLIMGDQREARVCARSITAPDGRPVTAVAYLSRVKHETDRCCVGEYGELKQWLVNLGIDELVIAERLMHLDEKADHIAAAQRFGVNVRYVANEREVILGASGRIGDHGLVLVPAALVTPEARELKRLVDWAIVTLTLPLWGSVLASYAAYSLVRRPGQPVLVRTDRIGLGNIPFAMLRLRTRTRIDAISFQGARPTGRVEAWFERMGLDEIPQVINVLRGEMSIVGPRPLHAQDVKRLSLEQRRALATRPGMTGRWQVEWGEDASAPEVRALDAEYTRRWRVSRDLDLIARTPILVARRRLYLGDTEIRRRMRTALLLRDEVRVDDGALADMSAAGLDGP